MSWCNCNTCWAHHNLRTHHQLVRQPTHAFSFCLLLAVSWLVQPWCTIIWYSFSWTSQAQKHCAVQRSAVQCTGSIHFRCNWRLVHAIAKTARWVALTAADWLRTLIAIGACIVQRRVCTDGCSYSHHPCMGRQVQGSCS